MCRDVNNDWKYKFIKELDKAENIRIFYRENKKPEWYEFVYESINVIDKGFKVIGSNK